MLFSWIDTNRMRLVVSQKLDTTVATRLKKLRPIPNNFALIADTPNMMKLLQKVGRNFNFLICNMYVIDQNY